MIGASGASGCADDSSSDSAVRYEHRPVYAHRTSEVGRTPNRRKVPLHAASRATTNPGVKLARISSHSAAAPSEWPEDPRNRPTRMGRSGGRPDSGPSTRCVAGLTEAAGITVRARPAWTIGAMAA